MQALRTITGQSSRLARLLSQLLDVTRLEAGRLTLERQSVDLSELADEMVTNARGWSDRHVVSLSAPPSLNVLLDPMRIEQVLTNLLSNAIKYSPDGGRIEVDVTRIADTEAEIAVRDRGLGIPPEKRQQIFERFYQAHANGHRSGMGLGLYVSRQIVEQHEGDIRVEFPPDGGSRFVVRLPVGLPVVPAVPATPAR